MLEQKKIHNYAFMWRTLTEFGMVRTTRTQLDCTCPRTEYTTSLGGIWCTTATFTHGLSIEDIGLANWHRWWILPLSPAWNRWQIRRTYKLYIIRDLRLEWMENTGTGGGVFCCAVLYCVVCCGLMSTAYFVNNEKWKKIWAEIVQWDSNGSASCYSPGGIMTSTNIQWCALSILSRMKSNSRIKI